MSIRKPSEALFGLFLLLLGLVVTVSATAIPAGFSYDTAGPRLFPLIIGGGLVLSAVLTLLGAIGGAVPAGPANDAEPAGRTDWWPVVVISGALLLEAAMIESAGWIPATGLVFAAGAWAFGDRRLVLNLVLGLTFGAAILAAFAFGLGLDLPLGPLEPLLRAAD